MSIPSEHLKQITDEIEHDARVTQWDHCNMCEIPCDL